MFKLKILLRLKMKNFNELNAFIGNSLTELSKTESAMKDFHALLEDIETDGALPKKTKILMAVSLAVKGQCSYCISLHVKSAIAVGATDEEIVESAWVAVLMGGGPSLMYLAEVKKALQDFRN